MMTPVVRIQLSEDNIENDYNNNDLYVTSMVFNQEELLEVTNRAIAGLKLASILELGRDTVEVNSVLKALESKDIYPIQIPTADWVV